MILEGGQFWEVTRSRREYLEKEHPDWLPVDDRHALAPALKLLKRLLHDRKGDANLQGFGVTDPLDL